MPGGAQTSGYNTAYTGQAPTYYGQQTAQAQPGQAFVLQRAAGAGLRAAAALRQHRRRARWQGRGARAASAAKALRCKAPRSRHSGGKGGGMAIGEYGHGLRSTSTGITAREFAMFIRGHLVTSEHVVIALEVLAVVAVAGFFVWALGSMLT